MISSKKEALIEFHRKQILTVAEQLFLEKGIEKTTMDEISKTADYSKATLYVYFKSKDEIVNHLTLNSMKMLYERLHQGVSCSSSLFDRYRSICKELTAYAKDYPLYFTIALGEINVDIENKNTPPIFKEIYELGECINAEIGDFLNAGIQERLLKEDIKVIPTIFVFWASITGLIQLVSQKNSFITKSMHMTNEEFLDYGFKMLLQSILKEDVHNVY